MGVREYKFAGDNSHLLNEYHRQLDSLGEWQINFTPYKQQAYAFDHIGSGALVSGYMPRGYNAGFIYAGGSEHTIAHELGHGIAGLEHVFKNSNNSGKTKNLMDYADGTQLWHFQWDEIQNPKFKMFKWRQEEIWDYNNLFDLLGKGRSLDIGVGPIVFGTDNNAKEKSVQGIHFGVGVSLGATVLYVSELYTKALILRPSEIPNLFKIFLAKEQRSSFQTGLEKCGDYLYLNLLGSRKNILLKVKKFDDDFITEDAYEKY